MKILLSVGHPAQVHLFKNVIWDLMEKGHEIKIVARKKEDCTDLLNAYGLDYYLISNAGNGLIGLGIEMFVRSLKFTYIIKKFNPDIIISMMDPSIAVNSKILRKKYISLNDTEHTTLLTKFVLPLADVVLTPSSFKKELGIKQIKYDGYHELAYLHPNHFKPNPEILKELGLNENDKFVVIRFVSWNAHHDVGQNGIQNKIEFVKELEKYCQVFITSEGKLDDRLEMYRLNISPEKLHDVLYYTSLYVGEGATTAVEAAILGTPSIYISSFAGTMGNFTELEDKYGLLFNYNNSDEALAKAVELIQKLDIEDEWKRKREQLLKDKIDVTAFISNFITKYS